MDQQAMVPVFALLDFMALTVVLPPTLAPTVLPQMVIILKIDCI